MFRIGKLTVTGARRVAYPIGRLKPEKSSAYRHDTGTGLIEGGRGIPRYLSQEVTRNGVQGLVSFINVADTVD